MISANACRAAMRGRLWRYTSDKWRDALAIDSGWAVTPLPVAQDPAWPVPVTGWRQSLHVPAESAFPGLRRADPPFLPVTPGPRYDTNPWLVWPGGELQKAAVDFHSRGPAE